MASTNAINSIYGVAFTLPESSPEGIPSIPSFHFGLNHCSTHQVFSGTVRGILYEGKPWFDAHKFPAFLIQLPKGNVPVQPKFFESIKKQEITVTNFEFINVQPDAYYLSHSEFPKMTVRNYLKSSGNDYWSESEYLRPSEHVWPTLLGKKGYYAEHIPIKASIPHDGLLARGTDLRRFECLLRVIREREKMSGIHTPMLYIGIKGAFFPLHLEDCSLASISKLLSGHPKIWFIMPDGYQTKIQEMLLEIYGPVLDDLGLLSNNWSMGNNSIVKSELGITSDSSKYPCERLIDHKKFLLHPRHFLDRDIPVFMAVQKASNVVVTLPGTPHFGFNTGLNYASAREFATVEWVKKYIVRPPRECLLPIKICPCLACLKKRETGELAFEVSVNLNHDLVFRHHDVDHISVKTDEITLPDLPAVEVVIDNSRWPECSTLDSYHNKLINDSSKLPASTIHSMDDNNYSSNTPTSQKKEESLVFWLDCLQLEEKNIKGTAHFKLQPRVRTRNRNNLVRQESKAKQSWIEIKANPEALAVFREKARIRKQRSRSRLKAQTNQ